MENSRWQWVEHTGLFSLFLTLVSLAAGMTINLRPPYVFNIGYLQILGYTPLGQETSLKNFGHLMDYLSNPLKTVLSLPDFPVSASGAHHFHGVKTLFLVDYAVFLITLVPSILSTKYLQKNDRPWRLIRPLQVGMLLPAVSGFFMTIGFDHFSILSREMSLNNDN